MKEEREQKLYHNTLAKYYRSKPLYLDAAEQKKPYLRKLMEQPWQMTQAGMWDEVTETLCNLDLIQAKAAAKLTYELVDDFKQVLEVIPDNAENVKQERKRQARLDKYAQDLIAYARGEIKDIEVLQGTINQCHGKSYSKLPVETKMLDTQQNSSNFIHKDSEYPIVESNPNRLETLQKFARFLGRDLCNLQMFAYDVPNFVYQQVWNDSYGGPIKLTSEDMNTLDASLLFLKLEMFRSEYDFQQQITRVFKWDNFVVTVVDLTYNGNIAIAGSREGTCIVWNVGSGKLIHRLIKHSEEVTAVSITPDGKKAFTASIDDICILWDLENGGIIHILKGHNFNPNSLHIFYGKERNFLRSHSKDIVSVSMTPDGRRALSGSRDRTCLLWDLESGEILLTMVGHKDEVTSVSITADGREGLSGSYDCSCILWNLENGSVIRHLQPNVGKLSSVSITPDGKRAVTGSVNKHFVYWDLETGSIIDVLRQHEDSINAVAIASDGRRALSGSLDKSCVLWNLEKRTVDRILVDHSEGVLSVVITPDGQRALSCSLDNSCILWDLDPVDKSLSLKRTPRIITETLNGEEESMESDAVRYIHVDTPWAREQLSRALKTDISIAVISLDGKRVLVSSNDNSIILWNMENYEIIHTLIGHIGEITSFELSYDWKMVIFVANEYNCILWGLEDGSIVHNLKGHTDIVLSVKFTPDGKRALSGSFDQTCIHWNLENGEIIDTLRGHTGYITTVCIAPDGRRALTGSSDETCLLWDLEYGRIIHTLRGHTDCVETVYITPDGSRALSGSYDKTFILWNLVTGNSIHTFKGHSNWVVSLYVTPDGKRVISKSVDGACILWNLENYELLHIFAVENDYINNVYITPDGKRALLYFSRSSTLLLWDLIANRIVMRNRIEDVLGILGAGRVLIGKNLGSMSILQNTENILYKDVPNTTARKIWDFEEAKYLPISADCPLCGHRFATDDNVLQTIKDITKEAKIKPEDSPCLSLPEDAWKNPGLLSHCPRCGETLKFNPFFAAHLDDDSKAVHQTTSESLMDVVEYSIRKGYWEAAIAALEKLPKLEPDSDIIQYQLAFCKIKDLKDNSLPKITEIDTLIGMIADSDHTGQADELRGLLEKKLNELKPQRKKPWWKRT